MLKYSRQRESIKAFLRNRYDHPTAETVYLGIKEEYPNISLGTVYRNLALLADLGDIVKISTGSGPDRYDGHIEPHYHFFCNECGGVTDLEMDTVNVSWKTGKSFHGQIDRNIIYFYGKCPECLKKEALGVSPKK